jgi:long-chain acyl-CoA synthetase
MNIANNLARSAFYFSDHPALTDGQNEITYLELNRMANRVATGLMSLGIKPGDLVALCAPNSLDWISFYYGILKAGAVAVTLSGALQAEELDMLLSHSNPRMIFTHDDKLASIEKVRAKAGIEKIICDNGDLSFKSIVASGTETFQAIDRDRNDTAAVLYTGGTTGLPKGVMLTHENIIITSHNVAYSERSSQLDRALCFLPLNHVFGQIHIMNATVFSSGCLELLPSYDMERFLARTSSGKITKLYAVPTVYTRLVALDGIKEKLGNVRYCFSAAASMAAEIVRNWKTQTNLTIYEGYGLTESSSAVTYNDYYNHVIGSVGTTVPGVEVQIRDEHGNVLPPDREGEVCIRGRNIMKGYLNNPEDTANVFWENGWFRSGDIGVFDGNDYLFLVDRLKDMIITGGENVYPREVEEVIYTLPDVQECAVVGLPDSEWGERVTAFVVSRPGKKVTPEELKSFLKGRLAPFKVPKQYLLVEEIPKNAAGKILKRELKKQRSSQS